MLNISKPFYLEGIGTITKNKTGKFDFSPGEYSLIKETISSTDHEKKKIYARDKNQSAASAVQTRNVLKVVALISALIIVGFGGWMVYKNNSSAGSEKIADTTAAVQEQQPSVSDSLVHDSTKHDTANPLR
jgi:hypothetical protein